MSPEPAVLHVRVSGRVQGVGYRAYVRAAAGALGVAGWVRNGEDGSVEVVAAGEPSALRELRVALVRGPAGARVSGVAELPPCEVPPGPFAVRR